jgi:hypothetical protein
VFVNEQIISLPDLPLLRFGFGFYAVVVVLVMVLNATFNNISVIA